MVLMHSYMVIAGHDVRHTEPYVLRERLKHLRKVVQLHLLLLDILVQVSRRIHNGPLPPAHGGETLAMASMATAPPELA